MTLSQILNREFSTDHVQSQFNPKDFARHQSLAERRGESAWESKYGKNYEREVRAVQRTLFEDKPGCFRIELAPQSIKLSRITEEQYAKIGEKFKISWFRQLCPQEEKVAYGKAVIQRLFENRSTTRGIHFHELRHESDYLVTLHPKTSASQIEGRYSGTGVNSAFLTQSTFLGRKHSISARSNREGESDPLMIRRHSDGEVTRQSTKSSCRSISVRSSSGRSYREGEAGPGCQ
jgi:hypothetical protein